MTHAPDTTATQVTSTGLAANLAGALAYLLGPITGIAFLVLEKENRFVRFHAAQSIAIGIILIVASIALSILSGILAVVPVLGWIAALLAGLAFGLFTFVLWVLLMWRAWNGREWEVPVAAGIARSMAR